MLLTDELRDLLGLDPRTKTIAVVENLGLDDSVFEDIILDYLGEDGILITFFGDD